MCHFLDLRLIRQGCRALQQVQAAEIAGPCEICVWKRGPKQEILMAVAVGNIRETRMEI